MGSASKQKGQKRLHSLTSPSKLLLAPPHDHAGRPLPQAGADAGLSCSDADARLRDDAGGSDNDADSCALALDGAAEDEILKGADVLTEEEVVRRRARRIKQLMRLYRTQYWGLLEELRSKYRVFYLKHGRGGWRDDIEAEKDRADVMECTDAVGNHDSVRVKAQEGAMKEPHPPDRSASDIIRCAIQGCKSKPLALSSFCFNHILSDPRQQLYKACTHVTRSGQSGSVACGKPVLRSVTPLFCSVHLQKQAPRRKANSAVSAVTSKPAPKLHLVIAEYVRHIQSKRRASNDTVAKHVSTVPSKDPGTMQQEQGLLSMQL